MVNGELTIYEAVKCLMIRHHEEKPGEGIISEKEALSEPHKIAQIQSEEISAKKARKTEISEKGGKRGRPRKEKIPGLTARLRDELEKALKALGIEDESEKELLMSEAAEVLGPYPVEVQSRAVKRWRESSGLISFQQALQEVVRGRRP